MNMIRQLSLRMEKLSITSIKVENLIISQGRYSSYDVVLFDVEQRYYLYSISKFSSSLVSLILILTWCLRVVARLPWCPNPLCDCKWRQEGLKAAIKIRILSIQIQPPEIWAGEYLHHLKLAFPYVSFIYLFRFFILNMCHRKCSSLISLLSSRNLRFVGHVV